VPLKHEHNNSAHGVKGHNHSHDLKNSIYSRLWWAFFINLIFLVVEVIGGCWSIRLPFWQMQGICLPMLGPWPLPSLWLIWQKKQQHPTELWFFKG
jgi:hypothetical protein